MLKSSKTESQAFQTLGWHRRLWHEILTGSHHRSNYSISKPGDLSQKISLKINLTDIYTRVRTWFYKQVLAVCKHIAETKILGLFKNQRKRMLSSSLRMRSLGKKLLFNIFERCSFKPATLHQKMILYFSQTCNSVPVWKNEETGCSDHVSAPSLFYRACSSHKCHAGQCYSPIYISFNMRSISV